MMPIIQYCNILCICNARVSYCTTAMSKKVVLKALLHKSCVCRIFPFERIINSYVRNDLSLFVLIM
jgi:hypothetical protein